ncbi:MAG: NUDIX domain-containing protein [Nanoarchaeota archaeon]
MEYEFCAGLLVFRVIDDKQQFLLVHPSRHAKGKYAIPKGHINDGEKTLTAAIRETYEETGVKAEPLHKLPEIEYDLKSGKRKRVTIFLAQYVSGVNDDGVSLKHDFESDDVRFFNIDNLPDIFSTQKPIIANAIKLLKETF